MEILIFIIVFIAGIIASFIGAIIGGAGLVSIPILVLIGLPPQSAIATSKFGSFALNIFGWIKYHKENKINYKIGVSTTLVATFGAYFGAKALLIIPEEILNKLVGTLLIGTTVLFLINNNTGIRKDHNYQPYKIFIGYLAIFIVGFWGAFFGGGFAIFATYVYILLFNQTFVECAGIKMLIGVGISIVSIYVYGINGAINWFWGIPLILGESIGAYIGAGVAVQKGDVWIKKIFIVLIISTSIKLLFF